MKTEDYSGINVRIKDASNETFQQLVLLDATTDWQQVVITEFATNNYWGGDGNGTFDGPVRGIEILSLKNRLKNGRNDGKLYVDFVEGVLMLEVETDGGFEQNLWTDRTARRRRPGHGGEGGEASAKLSGASASLTGFAELEPYADYELVVWAKSDAAALDALSVSAQPMNGNGQFTTAQPIPLGTIGGVHDWRRYSFDIGIVGEEKNYAKIFFLRNTSQGDVSIDGIEFVRKPESVRVEFQRRGRFSIRSDAAFQTDLYLDPDAPAALYTIRYEVPGSGDIIPRRDRARGAGSAGHEYAFFDRGKKWRSYVGSGGMARG